jgi:hypothetical protein
MEVEVQADRTAYRRHRRGMLLFLWAAALYLPGVLLALWLLKAVLGRQAIGPYAGAVFFASFLALGPIWLHGCRDAVFYRCPRCGRRLQRCASRDQVEPHINFLCGDCRTVWDLGWGFAREGGAGG